jgi:hypothetical protein
MRLFRHANGWPPSGGFFMPGDCAMAFTPITQQQLLAILLKTGRCEATIRSGNYCCSGTEFDIYF